MIHQPLNWLWTQGFKAYLIGNQVRAVLLGRADEPQDVDIATDARPEEVALILRRHRLVPTSIDGKFGVVNFALKGASYSITTFRRDLYSRGDLVRFSRYPSRVVFIKSVKEDAKRRDFTINAIYYHPLRKRFLDPVGGLKDWRQKIVRTVGEAEQRLEEDPLRIFRAIRLKNLLGFRYHSQLKRALTAKGFLTNTLATAVKARELEKMRELPPYQMILREMREFKVVG